MFIFFISLKAVTYLLVSQKVSVSLRCLSLWWFYYIIISVCDYLRLWAHYLASWWLCMWYLSVYCNYEKPQSSYEVQVIHDWTFCRSQTVGLCGWLGVIMVVYNESHVCNCSKNAGVSMETASWFHVPCFQMSCLLSWSQVRKFTGTEQSFWNTTRCWFVTLRSGSSKPNRVHSVPSRLLSQDSSKVTKRGESCLSDGFMESLRKAAQDTDKWPQFSK